MDALLLAAFAGQEPVRGRVLDLGTGCGVVGLGLALDHPDFFGVGLDLNPDMLRHAQENIHLLGFEERFALLRADARGPWGVAPESMDMVLCNPPYRDPGRGRTCPDEARTLARFESRAELADFVRAAACLVRNRKNCFFILLAERVDELLDLLRASRLQPKEVLFVHQRLDAAARLVLVRSLKNGGAGLTVRPPLVLHEGRGKETRLSAAALSFCPRLACNAARSGKDGDACP
ncbi:MAG: methyltransferase [Desulfomicrobium sp.]|nr:methyltransferase [Desulfomicrobium sp.]